MRRSRNLSTVLLLSLSCLVLVWAPSAGAVGDFPIEGCNASVASADGWDDFGGQLVMTDRCEAGEGLQIENDDSSADNEAGWRFAPISELEIVSFSFDIDGGDTSNGLKYGVRVCDVCADAHSIGARDSSSPTDHVDVVLAAPVAALTVYAKCTDDAFCPATGTPLRISNLSVTVIDSVPPEVSGSVVGFAEDEYGFRGWTNKQRLPVSLTATDGGFGVFSAAVRIGNLFAPAAEWGFEKGCLSATPPTLCRTSVEASADADVESLPDGIHEIQFSALDAGANAASAGAGRIGIDRSPPAAPRGPTLAYTPPGWPGQRWTSDPHVTLSWAPAPDLVEPEFESPIDSQTVSIRRLGSSTVVKPNAPIEQQSIATTLIADGEWSFDVNYNDKAGNAGTIATRSVGLDVDAPNPPQGLAADDWYSDAGLATGPRLRWEAPEENEELESGVCGYVVRIDASPVANPEFGFDDATIGTSWPLPAGLPEGQSYAHVRAVSCAGVPSVKVTVSLKVDTVAPQIGLTGIVGPNDWSSSAQQASLVATDAQSGVEAVGFAIDDEATTWVSDDRAAIDIPEGHHELKLSARDVAGNVSTLTREVRTDTLAPSVELGTAPLTDPTLASGTVQDSGSGLAAASIELRRVDQAASTAERQWQTVGGPEPITRGATSPTDIARHIDDSKLEAGEYELRVNAADVAGNSAVVGSFAIRSLRLPLRRPADLSVALADVVKVCRTGVGTPCPKSHKCKAKQKCKTVRLIEADSAKASVVRTWSQKSALVGDVLDTNGAPLAGVSVSISGTAPFHEPESFGSTTTDAAGHFEKLLPDGPTRVFAVRIDGSATQQPATASATRNVRSDIEFTPTPTTVRAGDSSKLAGRVLHPEWLPVGGVPVRFQWYSPNGWADFAVPTKTDARGRFSVLYPWNASVRQSTVKLRARIDGPTGWPFAAGSSESVRVHIVPRR